MVASGPGGRASSGTVSGGPTAWAPSSTITWVPGAACGSAVTTTSAQPPDCQLPHPLLSFHPLLLGEAGEAGEALQVPAPYWVTRLVTLANASDWRLPSGKAAVPTSAADTGWSSPPGPRSSMVSSADWLPP